MSHKITEEDSMMAKKAKEKYTGPRVTDTSTFIQKARWMHGDKYDYSKVEYVNAKTKVEIVCRKHGGYWQIPNDHAYGKNCPECAGMRSLSKSGTEWFIEKAKKVHGETYDYSKVQYEWAFAKVEIICKHHGSFFQTPDNHINRSGKGCPKCNRKTMKTQDWVYEFRKVHGDRYEYYMFSYEGFASTKQYEFVCKVHGAFLQSVSSHVKGAGCPSCRVDEFRKRVLKTNEYFIKKSKEVHGDRYDYGLCDYQGMNHKVSIKCNKHGIFYQSARNHISGNGCPDCAHEERSMKWNPISQYGIRGYYGTNKPSNLYIFSVGDEFLKVGLAVNVTNRVIRVNRETSLSVEKIYSVPGKASDLFELEQGILRDSGLKNHVPSIKFGGKHECLELSELPKVLKIIKEWEEDKKSEEDA